ncbi:MAG: nitroreductase family deazaflavin-dependent oxidoreductase [Actinomycetota bacterium]
MPDPNDWNAKIIEEFRANQGQVGGMFAGRPLLLLHHEGAKTGTKRVNPLAYQARGSAYAVFASAAGAPKHPDWYHNLVTHPDTTVEVGTQTIPVRARVAGPAERDEIFSRQAQEAPDFAAYQTKTTRVIPVVVLEPVP